MLILKPGFELDLRAFDRPPALEDLQAGVGDYFQAVPSFDTISYGGTVLNCIAFCNEHGKLARIMQRFELRAACGAVFGGCDRGFSVAPTRIFGTGGMARVRSVRGL
jgi:hypothetical protein